MVLHPISSLATTSSMGSNKETLLVLFSSLLLHHLVEKISECSQSPYQWLVFGVLCRSSEDLSVALDIIESEGPLVGLSLNCSKSLLYSPEPTVALPSSSGIPVVSEGFVLLGAHGPCRAFASERVEKIHPLIGLLPCLKDSQAENSLLHSCLSLPKFQCILRTSSPEVILPVCMSFDIVIFDALPLIF